MSSLARRAHPFTCGAVALTLIALSLVLPTAPQTTLLYAFTATVAWAAGAGSGVRRAVLVLLPVWLLLFLLQGVLGEGARVAAPWGGTLSGPGLQWAASQGSRLAVITTASLSFASVFDPHRFLQAAIDRRWPFGMAFLVVATLDASTQLREQARQVREAQRTRGVRVTGSIAARIRAFPALVFPLLLAALTEADDRALALETRGLLVGGPRTAIDPPRDTTVERALRWSLLVGVVATTAWRALR